jgi:hypothetical protein
MQRFVFTEMERLVPARYSSLTVKVMVDTSLFRHRGLTSYLFARSKYMKTLIVSLNYVIFGHCPLVRSDNVTINTFFTQKYFS